MSVRDLFAYSRRHQASGSVVGEVEMGTKTFAHSRPNVLTEALQNGVSRRGFLKAGAAGRGGPGLSVAVDDGRPRAADGTFEPNAFLRNHRHACGDRIVP